MRTLTFVLILASLALTPLYNIGEVLAFTFGGLKTHTAITSPLWVKLVKDSLLILIGLSAAAVTLAHAIRTRRLHPVGWAYLPLLIVVAITIPYSYVTNENVRAPGGLIFIASGLRWLFPIALSFLLIGIADKALLRRIAIVCTALFLLSFAVQVYQLFNATTWFGRNTLGLSARVSGIFLLPATSGFFTCLTVFLTQTSWKESPLRHAVLVLAPFSIFFTASVTAIVLLGTMVLFGSFGGRYLKAKLIALPVLAAVAYFVSGPLLGRNDFADVSGPVRARHFLREVGQATLLSNRFGFGTNAAVLADAEFEAEQSPEVLDSMYASVLANLGWVGAAAMTVPVAAGLALVARSRRLDGLVFIAMYILAGLSQTITESFPMNLLLAVWIGYFVGETWDTARAPRAQAPQAS